MVARRRPESSRLAASSLRAVPDSSSARGAALAGCRCRRLPTKARAIELRGCLREATPTLVDLSAQCCRAK
eukprot:60956-Karenia_brevis.AAC.1